MLRVIWGRIEDRRVTGTAYGRAAHDDDAWLVKKLTKAAVLLTEAQRDLCADRCVADTASHTETCRHITELLTDLGPLT